MAADRKTNLPDRILLIQARSNDDPMLQQERECFADKLECSTSYFEYQNLVEEPFDPSVLKQTELCLVGGSGSFSLVDIDAAWKESLVDAMKIVAENDVPMFASCFGFHALVRAFGGTLEKEPDRSELGTFTIELTDRGKADPLFKQLPHRFNAQLGHQDSITELPDSLERLASSERCDIQAIRHKAAPIVATQFHPELTHHENIERFHTYIQHYKEPDESIEEAKQRAIDIHSPSPESNQLLNRFIETEL